MRRKVKLFWKRTDYQSRIFQKLNFFIQTNMDSTCNNCHIPVREKEQIYTAARDGNLIYLKVGPLIVKKCILRKSNLTDYKNNHEEPDFFSLL